MQCFELQSVNFVLQKCAENKLCGLYNWQCPSDVTWTLWLQVLQKSFVGNPVWEHGAWRMWRELNNIAINVHILLKTPPYLKLSNEYEKSSKWLAHSVLEGFLFFQQFLSYVHGVSVKQWIYDCKLPFCVCYL